MSNDLPANKLYDGNGASSVSPDPEAKRRDRRQSQAKICFAILGVFAIIAGFSHPVQFLFGLACGGYAVYLHRGGTSILWGSLKPRKRSRAWAYYAIIAAAALVLGFAHPAFLAVAVLAGGYATYLFFRGGRWDLWIWQPRARSRTIIGRR